MARTPTPAAVKPTGDAEAKGSGSSLWAVVLPPTITGVIGLVTGVLSGWHPLESKAPAAKTEAAVPPGIAFRAYWLNGRNARYDSATCAADAVAVLTQAGFGNVSMTRADLISGGRDTTTALVSCKNAKAGYVFMSVAVSGPQDREVADFVSGFGQRLADEAGQSFAQSE